VRRSCQSHLRRSICCPSRRLLFGDARAAHLTPKSRYERSTHAAVTCLRMQVLSSHTTAMLRGDCQQQRKVRLPGGWKEIATRLEIYQQADATSVLAVMSEPRKLHDNGLRARDTRETAPPLKTREASSA